MRVSWKIRYFLSYGTDRMGSSKLPGRLATLVLAAPCRLPPPRARRGSLQRARIGEPLLRPHFRATTSTTSNPIDLINQNRFSTIRFPTTRRKKRCKTRPPKLDPLPKTALLNMYCFSTVTPFWGQIVGPVLGVVFCIVFWHVQLGNV